MKLVYITSTSFVDGDFPLVKYLIEKEVDVHLFIHVRTSCLNSTLFSLKQAYPKSGIFDSSIYGEEIDKFKPYIGIDKIHIINTNSGGGFKGMRSICKMEEQAIREIDPDVVHFIGWPELYEIPLTFKFYKKIIVTIHDPVPHKIDGRAKKFRMVRLATDWIIRRYILLNPLMTDDFCKYYRLNKSKIRYSRLGNYDVLKMFGEVVPSTQKTILFVGRISEYKGIVYLLEAYSQIMHSYPDTKLVVAGGGEYHFDITPYQNNPQIEIVNRYIDMDEMGYYFKNCEFVVCPYVTATQSGVVVSALAVNKPIIVTNVGGLPSMIEEGKSGLIIPPKDATALANAMSRLLSNPDQLKEMENYIAKDAVQGSNAWGKIAENYIKIYDEFIKP